MLQAIRDRLVGWVAWGIVILISVPFIVLGVTDFGSPVRENTVAEVNGEEISQQDFRRRFDARRQALQRQLGASYRPDILDPQIQQQVLDSMIEEKLLDLIAQQNNVQVGDGELASVIQNDPRFYQNGKFDFQYYRSIVGQSGFTPETYERYLRDDRAVSILPRIVETSGFITDAQASKYSQLLNQQRDIDYVMVDSEQFQEDVVVSDEEARAYYDSNHNEFTRPEQIRFEYVRSDAQSLAAKIEATEQDIRQYYEEHINSFLVEEQRAASHILLTMDEGKTLADSPEVQRKLDEIQQKIDAGETFESLAKEYSEDPGSAQQGGSLGQVLRGVMVPPFEEALYALTEKGQISEPVRTSFGIHLIRLDDLTPRQVKSFEEVKDQLQSEYAKKRAVELYYDQSERMAEISYERPDSLTPVAETLGMSLQTTDWVSMNNDSPGIEGNKNVLRLAFSERLKSERINSEPIEIGENDALIIRVVDTRPEKLVPYEEITEEVKKAARASAIRDRAVKHAEQLAARLQQGEKLSDLASVEQLTVKSVEGLQRSSPDIPEELSKAVFTMPAPIDGKPAVATFPQENGQVALVQLRRVYVNSTDAAGQDRERLALINATRTARMMLTDLREKATVVIHKDKL
jgi:peptidyl-prolyl cis-trans isomerase D